MLEEVKDKYLVLYRWKSHPYIESFKWFYHLDKADEWANNHPEYQILQLINYEKNY